MRRKRSRYAEIMGIDWLTASQADRKTLYRHIKLIVDRHFGGGWSRFYEAVFEQAVTFGQGYEDNFRAGRISRKRAAAIFDWIEANHPDEAATIIAAVGASVAAPNWEGFMQMHGEDGRLRIVPLDDPTLTIVAFAARMRVERIRLGQAFCFALDSAFDGAALALQSVDGRWYPLPLATDAPFAPIVTGDQFLPRDRDSDQPIPLSEDTHLGTHRFGVVTWRGALDAPFEIGRAIPPDRLNRLSRLLAKAEQWAIHRLDILFTP